MTDVLTVAQAAELLDCEPETVELATRERRLPGIKYGRSWVYPREALLEALNEQARRHVVERKSGGKVLEMASRKPRARKVPPVLPVAFTGKEQA